MSNPWNPYGIPAPAPSGGGFAPWDPYNIPRPVRGAGVSSLNYKPLEELEETRQRFLNFYQEPAPGTFIFEKDVPYFPYNPAVPTMAGTGSDGSAALAAQSQAMLAQTLQMLQDQLAQGRGIIQNIADTTSAGAEKVAKRLEKEFGPQRSQEAYNRYEQSAEAIAARESEIAAAAGTPEGMAGVYVAPGNTRDWEMMMRAAAPREAQYVTNMTNITADEARSYALEAQAMGASYIGSLVNLIAGLSAQAQMEAAAASYTRGGGGGAAGAEGTATSTLDGRYRNFSESQQETLAAYGTILEQFELGQVSERTVRAEAIRLGIDPRRVDYDIYNIKGNPAQQGVPGFTPFQPVE